MTVLATAGHVDHGKSTLVRALTGVDPDRWAEEKERGLTIDLGFGACDLPSGRTISFIDVPGHTRFLRNMLAGVGAVEACVFVVAATEGWKPQSEEHLRILDLLGVSTGIVALTKIDQVDDELRELAELDVAEHVEDTFLDGAPVIGVAALEGLGINELRVELDQLVDRLGPPRDRHHPRLWIDRAFAPAGAGAVVTGTLIEGSLANNDSLEVAPLGQRGRIRGLQTHHQTLDSVGPGHRVAVNLSGLAHTDLERGQVLVEPNEWHHTSVLDAELTVLHSLRHDLSRRGAYAAYFGSGEFPARVRIIGRDKLSPGDTGAIRLYLANSLPLLPGDRYILREHGRDETVGGGVVLDVEPQLPASRAQPDQSIERVVAERGWVDVEHLRRITGQAVAPTAGHWVVDPGELARALDEVSGLIDEAGALGLDLSSLTEQQRSVLDQIDDVTVEAGRAVKGEPIDPLADHPYVDALEAAPFQPPGPDGFDRAEVRELVKRGTIIESNGIFFAASAVNEAVNMLAAALRESPDGLTIAEIRDLLGTTRKFVLALADWFDRNGITRRRDDYRIPGPRLPD